jgi:hypothetical protein
VRRDARWYRALPLRGLWITVGWTLVGAIVVGSLVDVPVVGSELPQGDKLQHVLAYAIATAWFAQIAAGSRSLALHGLGLVLLGLALEGLQALAPGRHVEVADLLANAVGVGLGLAVGHSRLRDLLARALGAASR